jgi:phosphoribosylformylglycinamidine cyclo-ligase
VRGVAHITGGGLLENVPRILRQGLAARLHRDAWDMPELFKWLQREGGVADKEMHRVFNCGIGMVVVVPAEQADAVIALFEQHGEKARRIGEIVEQAEGEPQTVVV